VAREVIGSSLAHEGNKTRRKLFEWLSRNVKCFELKWFCNSYAVK